MVSGFKSGATKHSPPAFVLGSTREERRTVQCNFPFLQPTISFERQENVVLVFASAAAVVVVAIVSADVLLVFDNVVLVSHDKLSLACCHEYSANLSTNSVHGLFRLKSKKKPFRFNRPAINDTYDPGMMYYFLSTVADVSANPKINASAVYFSPNMSYTPSYRGFFNLTMPLFGPRTYRYIRPSYS